MQRVPDDTLISRARRRAFVDMDKVVTKDSLGNVIPREEAEKIDWTVYFAEQYSNEKGEIVEMVIRRIRPGDQKLLRDLMDAFQEGEVMVLIDVNCAEVKQMLENVYDIDQENRQAGNQIDMNVDRGNQVKVVSIIEKCGWPEKDKVGAKGMEAVFLVIQHASRKMRAKYFPYIKSSAEKGDLSLGSVAVMEDRMLMENGQKQKYGSQVVRKGDGPWTLYPIEDPGNVNKRRASMGLGPIEEYLRHFEIEYKRE